MKRWTRVVVLTLLGLLGAFVGASIAPAAHASLGPLSVDVQVRPSLRPGVAVALPPVGTVRFDTHLSPLAVQASIPSVDLDEARQLVSSPTSLAALQASAPDVLRSAAFRAFVSMLACALIGSTLLAWLATRGWRGLAAGAAMWLGALVVIASSTALTFDGAQLAQPRFTGLLSSAPYVQRRTETLAQRLESYRSGLADFVQSVTTLYALGDRLTAFDPSAQKDVITVLHISDLHLNPLGYDLTGRLVRQFKAEAIIDSGDLSTWGSTAEEGFVRRIGSLGVPYVFVRGNHDSAAIAAAVGRQRGAVVLDGDVRTVAGLRIAGVADTRNSPAEGRTTPPTRTSSPPPSSASPTRSTSTRQPTRTRPCSSPWCTTPPSWMRCWARFRSCCPVTCISATSRSVMARGSWCRAAPVGQASRRPACSG